MALTSSTGTVVGNAVTYQVKGTGSARGEGIMAYVNYTKGASDTITVKIYFQNTNIDTNFYQQIVVDNYILTKFEYTMGFSGFFRLPLPSALNEEAIKIEFDGLVDGDLNIELSVDNGYV